jgi:peptidoglycan/LPS O-acetylase OafA/YrhL
MKQKVIPNITAKKRINEIDLLRFFAVIAVVFFHYAFRGYTADKMSVMPYPLAPIAKYGYFGVHLFFMISGFVILMTASSGNLRRFIVSRVARLYPAFWVCCTITFAITMLIGAPRYTASVSQYLINMTMLSGFVSVKSIDGVYWSLFVELRFYALVGLIMLIGKINKAQLFLAVWLVICITLDVLNITKMRYLLIVDYAAFFIAGATFFLIWSKGLSPQRIAMIFGSLGLALYETIRGMPSFEQEFNTEINNFIVAAIIVTFFVTMLLISLNRTGYFGSRQWVLAGAITYPLYLLHQNIGFMIFNAAYPAINAHLLLWGTLIAAITASLGVHIFIEKQLSLRLKALVENLIDSSHHATTHLFKMIGRGRY